jgi:hypothetical protein
MTTYIDANHRPDEKPPTSVVHEMLLVHRSIIDALANLHVWTNFKNARPVGKWRYDVSNAM